MCLRSRTQHSDTGEARTHGLSVSSQALYHWATALPEYAYGSEYVMLDLLLEACNCLITMHL